MNFMNIIIIQQLVYEHTACVKLTSRKNTDIVALMISGASGTACTNSGCVLMIIQILIEILQST
jgi:hypothetical protein